MIIENGNTLVFRSTQRMFQKNKDPNTYKIIRDMKQNEAQEMLTMLRKNPTSPIFIKIINSSTGEDFSKEVSDVSTREIGSKHGDGETPTVNYFTTTFTVK
jgi:hypothetical protein